MHARSGRGRWTLGALELPEDRELAGRLAGLLYLAGAAAVIVILLLPQVEHDRPGLVLAFVGAGAVWGSRA